MKILGAFDKYKDSFTAQEACLTAEQVVEQVGQGNQFVSCPLSDGGEGFVDILTTSAGGDLIEVSARDSLGNPKSTQIGIVPLERLSSSVRSFLQLSPSGKLAVVEMASVCGLSDLQLAQRNPWFTSTVGIGDLLLSAKKMSVDCILLGVGGSSTNDAGIGALTSLGLNLKDSNDKRCDFPSPSSWEKIVTMEMSSTSLPPIRIACDVENILLGDEGATKQFGPQKGLPKDQTENMESTINQMVNRLSTVFPDSRKCSTLLGSGAAGGVGFGLSLAFDVKMVSGFDLISNWLMLEKEISSSDLIITGEGRFDETSFRGKGPASILRLAEQLNKPAILLCGSMDKTVVTKFQQEFPRFEWFEISKKNLTLNENLFSGLEFFKQTIFNILKSENLTKVIENSKKRTAKHKRIRRIKKFLRPLPRRSNVHKYPIIKWFAETAYRRSYLWSFKGPHIRSALFWGIWISMLPIVGIQMIVVFFVSLLVRANLPFIVALQWISNPFTMGPIYFADYKIGMIILELMGFDYPRNKLLSPDYDWSHFTYKEVFKLIDTFPPMFLGGSVLGIFLGVITVFIYKTVLRLYLIKTD